MPLCLWCAVTIWPLQTPIPRGRRPQGSLQAQCPAPPPMWQAMLSFVICVWCLCLFFLLSWKRTSWIPGNWYILTFYLVSFSSSEKNRPGQSEDFRWDMPGHVSREGALHAGDAEPAERIWSDPRHRPGGAPHPPGSLPGHCLYLILGVEVGRAGRGGCSFLSFAPLATWFGCVLFRVWWACAVNIIRLPVSWGVTEQTCRGPEV